MATYQQRKTTIDPQTGMPLTSDPVDPASPSVHVTQRTGTTPEGSMTGIIIAAVIALIAAILAFNYGWFDGNNAPNVTQNNTTETVPQATAPETTSPTVTEPDATTSTTTTTEPSGSETTTTTTTDP